MIIVEMLHDSCPLALVALIAAALLRRIRRPALPAMVRTLSSLEKGKRRNVVSASKEACLLAEYRLGPLQ